MALQTKKSEPSAEREISDANASGKSGDADDGKSDDADDKPKSFEDRAAGEAIGRDLLELKKRRPTDDIGVIIEKLAMNAGLLSR